MTESFDYKFFWGARKVRPCVERPDQFEYLSTFGRHSCTSREDAEIRAFLKRRGP